MGNCVSYNCSCACIDACSHSAHATSAFTPETCCKKRLEKTITVLHTVEQRVLEMGGGAPMTVAELMLEYPGHFVAECETDIFTSPAPTANSSSTTTATASTSKRATPLPADHEASPGRIYILFPMHRLHTRVAAHEYTSYIGLLSRHFNAPIMRKKSLHSLMMMQASSAKVTPISSLHLDELPPHLSASHQPDEEIDDEIMDSLLQHFCSSQNEAISSLSANGFSKSGSLVRSKSWIPKLETINESSVLVV